MKLSVPIAAFSHNLHERRVKWAYVQSREKENEAEGTEGTCTLAFLNV